MVAFKHTLFHSPKSHSFQTISLLPTVSKSFISSSVLKVLQKSTWILDELQWPVDIVTLFIQFCNFLTKLTPAWNGKHSWAAFYVSPSSVVVSAYSFTRSLPLTRSHLDLVYSYVYEDIWSGIDFFDLSYTQHDFLTTIRQRVEVILTDGGIISSCIWVFKRSGHILVKESWQYICLC